MKRPKDSLIVVIIKGISRSSGGMSSILDLCEALHSLGYSIAVVCSSGHLVYFVKRVMGRNKTVTTLPSSALWTLPDMLLPNKNHFRIGFRGRVASALRSLGSSEKRFKTMLTDASIIIEACGMNNDDIAKLKTLTNANILANHAGSPEAYIKYWMTDEKIGNDSKLAGINDQQQRYIEWAKAYDGILFQCQEQADQAIELGAVTKSGIGVVYPSCQERDVLLASNTENPLHKPVLHIVCVGSLQYRKGQDLALQAFALVVKNIQDVHLHFVGGGLEADYGANLQRLCDSLHLSSKVTFHGHREDYLTYMAHSNCILQSSRAEGVSRILREAMLMKKPIISYAISGTKSILTHEVDAELVEPESVESLANGMMRVLENGNYASKIASSVFERYLIRHSSARYCMSIKDMISKFNGQIEV